MTIIKLNQLSQSQKGRKTDVETRPPPKHRKGEWFLKGPIPWNWYIKAARLPGKSLHVASAIWLLAGMKNKRTVKLTGRPLKELKIGRQALYRGLKRLEANGLISVRRGVGRRPIVTLLSVQKKMDC